MNQLNSLIIEGNVTRDPEVKQTANGFKVCNVPIAVNRFYKNSNGEGVNEVSYFNIETFGKMAEACQEKCTKGRGIRVVGRIRQSRWITAEGKKSSKVSIIAEHVEFKKRIASVSEEVEKSEELDISSEENLEAMKEANIAAAAQEVQAEVPEEALVF